VWENPGLEKKKKERRSNSLIANISGSYESRKRGSQGGPPSSREGKARESKKWGTDFNRLKGRKAFLYLWFRRGKRMARI